jgi:hypothetical protein
MRTIYYEQLRRHLEPENTSLQSKRKSSNANSQHSASVHGITIAKTKQDLFRNQRPPDSFSSSLDATGLM